MHVPDNGVRRTASAVESEGSDGTGKTRSEYRNFEYLTSRESDPSPSQTRTSERTNPLLFYLFVPQSTSF